MILSYNIISGKRKKRRAVSDVIGTLLLVAITVTGATLLVVMINGSNLTKSIGGDTNQNLPPQILLIGYDTRDGPSLAGIPSLANKFNGYLVVNPTSSNAPPASGGTEYITLRIRNAGATSVNINSVTVNETSHSWDGGTLGNNFIGDNTGLFGKNFPGDGKFSIIKSNQTYSANIPPKQQSSLIPGSTDAILIIKLSPVIHRDIPISSIIRIVLNVQNINAATTFAIPAGSAK